MTYQFKPRNCYSPTCHRCRQFVPRARCKAYRLRSGARVLICFDCKPVKEAA